MSYNIKYRCALFGRGDDTVGNPHRGQIYQFELFELVLLPKLDKRFQVEQFEASRAIRGSSISVNSIPPSYRDRLSAEVTFGRGPIHELRFWISEGLTRAGS